MTEVRWKYLRVKEVDGKQETREVIETKSGSLKRLIAIADKPLTADEQRDETEGDHDSYFKLPFGRAIDFGGFLANALSEHGYSPSPALA
jgi:hypothetical protein